MLCENCLHTEVCGIEGYYEEALKFCANRILNNCEWIEDAPGIYRCPTCGHTEGLKRNFCCNCGSKFNV
jgi:hypothetical protein